jgi:hypothetical protein
MTREEALEIKAITDQCLTTIPSQYVDFIYVMYTRHIDPEQAKRARPCTCTGRYWTDYLFRLKDKVTDTLREIEETVNTEGNL